MQNSGRVLVQKQFDRSSYVQLYTLGVSIAGLVVILFAFRHLPQDIFGIVLFALLSGLTELFSVELFASSHSRVSISNIISVASFLLFGPLAGVITMLTTGIMTTITTTILHQEPARRQRASWLQRGLFNIGMLVISTAAGGLFYQLTGGVTGTILLTENLLPLVLAVGLVNLVNITLLIGVISIQTGQPYMHIWNRDFRWSVPIGVLGGVVGGGALGLAYEMFDVLGAAVFFLPIFLINYSYRMYVSNTKEYVNQLEEMNHSLEEANLGLLEALGRVIDAYDMYTYGHSAQVAVYARTIGQKLGLPAEDQQDLMRAGLIHDIGKVGIKDSILSKPGPLTPQERIIINRHPDIGASIIEQMKGLQRLVPLVRHHHERWDGRGYPDGLVGKEIPLGARIMAMADALEVMGSDRPYRKALGFQQTIDEIKRCSGTQFDPEVAQAILDVIAQEGETFLRNSAQPSRSAAQEVGGWSAEAVLAALRKS